MKFWTWLRWLGSALFVLLWLWHWLGEPVAGASGGDGRPVPVFVR